ncbi:MAG: type II toxin-antitoxin system Phd/YefM family antitoxin [Phycisphaerae bacterium]|nr:type II toxin-antitoxin system Phd/YefM family antitoxin [Phycisphaerae bacterium]
MFQPPDIRPLTEFQRDAKSHISRLKKTGRAEILTVNGRAAVVVQDAAAYQRLCELADRADDIDRTLQAIREMDAGLGRPFEQVAKELRAKFAAKTRRKSA